MVAVPDIEPTPAIGSVIVGPDRPTYKLLFWVPPIPVPDSGVEFRGTVPLASE